jgi:hypothetical protein
MSDNRLLESDFSKAEYNSLTASINYEYSKKYGYDFIYYRPYLNKNEIQLNNCIDPNTKLLRHCAWSKLLSTRLALDLDYDYVVYIDSDCIFKNFSISLEQFIIPYVNNNWIFLNNTPWKDHLPCSGFFICKVCPDVKEFVKEWYAYDFKTKKNPCRWEQGVLWNLYTDPKYNIAIHRELMFLEKEGQFLRHITSVQKIIKRLPYFTKFIKDNKIPFENNISEIKYIEFNTTVGFD